MRPGTQVPPGLLEMLRVPGLGVQRVRQIHARLGIDNLPDLETAALDGRLAQLPRFGARTAENILRSIRLLRQAGGRRLRHHAELEAAAVAGALWQVPGVAEVFMAGALRRASEVIPEVVLVAVADVVPAELFQALGRHRNIVEIAGQDERRVTLRLASGSVVQVVATPRINLGAVLVEATGSDAHVDRLARRAAALGMSLTGAALWRGSTFVPTPDEPALYGALGLDWIPPELREGGDELDLAASHRLPRLVETADLQGLLHCHTAWSDGSSSVEALAVAARDAGYRWIGITDHGPAAVYAGGLSGESLAREADEIDALSGRLDGIRILKGVEADILQDGAVDVDAAAARRLDFVIASVHSRFGQDRAAMTARILRALEHPAVTILGHPTGRLLLSREPYDVDLDAILERAAGLGVAVEVNADPHRLDLDWRYLARARALGVRIAIGADAHGVAGLDHMRHGVGIARKGRLAPTDVLNTMSAEAFLDFARSRR